MEDKIDELSDEIQYASKQIDESFDRIIQQCEDLLVHLKRVEDKLDRYIEQR